MANGARYGLPAMVVGAFFSIERDALLAIGGSDERLVGWGCEDTLIGARSVALGNVIVLVYSAVAWHVCHPRREDVEMRQFQHNLAKLNAIYSEPFETAHPDLDVFRARAIEVVDPAHAWAHFDRAHSRAQQGFIDQALESMRRADDLVHPLDGNRSWIHSALAAFHLQLGNTIIARAEVDRALMLCPDNEEARAVQARLQ
jgi:hypothetical protein